MFFVLESFLAWALLLNAPAICAEESGSAGNLAAIGSAESTRLFEDIEASASLEATESAETLSSEELIREKRVREEMIREELVREEMIRESTASEATVGSIYLELTDIFDLEDPRENRWLYRLANRLHRSTRPWVVEQQLLFRPGDPFSAEVLAESERLLRENRFLYDAEVKPVAYDREQNIVDVEVLARDVWTLSGGVQVDRKGGENSVGFEIKDSNVFGTGKSIRLERTDDVDRTMSRIRYWDPNVLGSRFEGELFYADNSDGGSRRVKVIRPFFSLSSKWSAGFLAYEDDRVTSIYQLGEITERFQHQTERLEGFYGRSGGLKNHRVHRWKVGFTYERDRFSIAPEKQRPSFIPEDRVLSFPWIGVESESGRYDKLRDFDQISRTEDLRLGWTWSGRLGYSSTSLGADRDGPVFDVKAEWGRHPTPGRLLLFDTLVHGRYTNSQVENLRFTGRFRYYQRNWGKHLFFLLARFDSSKDIDQETQLLLGGDSGLRGYPLRYQSGDHSALLTLEQRFFTDWYPFRLVYVGAAVFADVGRTWTDDAAGLSQGMLTDVGFGLRLAPSRSGLGSVVHFDVAFPLNGDPSIEDVQWLVTTKKSF